MAASSAMQVETSCALVLLQCRDREWYGDARGEEAWAWRAAQKCINAGFGVLRVPTQNWNEVKRDHPDRFFPCFRSNLNRQHVICTINFIHLVCPLLHKVQEMMQHSADDNVAYCLSLTEHGAAVHAGARQKAKVLVYEKGSLGHVAHVYIDTAYLYIYITKTYKKTVCSYHVYIYVYLCIYIYIYTSTYPHVHIVQIWIAHVLRACLGFLLR